MVLGEEAHKQWLVDSAARCARAVRGAGPGTATFAWAGYDYDKRPVGIVVHYSAGYDLTAALLGWWFNHQPGGTPSYHLDAVRDAAGPLWDAALVRELWAPVTGDGYVG